jgi:hypothetical protein
LETVSGCEGSGLVSHWNVILYGINVHRCCVAAYSYIKNGNLFLSLVAC